MTMLGDGPEDQPSEGVVTLDSLAANMDSEEEGEALEESAEGEEAEESEEVEAEEEEAGQDDEDEQAEEPTFTIKVNGKDVEVKQSELIELGQKGLDYSQKTMAVAEERKAVEAARSQAEERRSQFESAHNDLLQRVQAFEGFIGAQLGNPPPITLAQQDAAQYLAQKELYENRKGQLEQARAAIQALQAEQNRVRQSEIQRQADETEKALRDTLPGWNDEMLNDLSKYARDLGLTPDKVDIAFVQEGFWKALHKAKAYDELQAKKAEMKPVAKLNKVAKPGANNQPPQLAKRQEAMKRHNAKPSLETLADLL